MQCWVAQNVDLGLLLTASIRWKSMSRRLKLAKMIHFHWLVSSGMENIRADFEAVQGTDTTTLSVTPFQPNTASSS